VCVCVCVCACMYVGIVSACVSAFCSICACVHMYMCVDLYGYTHMYAVMLVHMSIYLCGAYADVVVSNFCGLDTVDPSGHRTVGGHPTGSKDSCSLL
jgi:hypothetical protein